MDKTVQTQDTTQTHAPAAAEQQLPVREKPEAPEAGSYEGRWFEPAVDIYETADALTVVADLPGIAAEDVSTDLKDNLLSITARMKQPASAWKPLDAEFAEGHYFRQFRLGQSIDRAKITAELRDGVLTLTLPKADSARPRKIQVKTA